MVGRACLVWIVLSSLPLSAFGFDSHGDRNPVDPDRLAEAVAALAAEEYVCLTASDGWGGILSGWEKQEALDRIADADALTELADKHPCATVRTASFLLLVRRGEKSSARVMFAHLRDTATVGVQAFDVAHSGRNVADAMVSLVTNCDENEREKLLATRELARLDSILIFTADMSHIPRQRIILAQLPVDDAYYDRLVAMYEQERIMEALPAIAKYRRAEDKELIIEALGRYALGLDDQSRYVTGRPLYPEYTYNALKAVIEWPDPDFIPALLSIRDYEVKREYIDFKRIRMFYGALMAYNNELTYEIIDNTLAMKPKFHSGEFRDAYDIAPKPLYAPLVKKYRKDYTGYER